jgi:hypothetical protein
MWVLRGMPASGLQPLHLNAEPQIARLRLYIGRRHLQRVALRQQRHQLRRRLLLLRPQPGLELRHLGVQPHRFHCGVRGVLKRASESEEA